MQFWDFDDFLFEKVNMRLVVPGHCCWALLLGTNAGLLLVVSNVALEGWETGLMMALHCTDDGSALH